MMTHSAKEDVCLWMGTWPGIKSRRCSCQMRPTAPPGGMRQYTAQPCQQELDPAGWLCVTKHQCDEWVKSGLHKLHIKCATLMSEAWAPEGIPNLMKKKKKNTDMFV